MDGEDDSEKDNSDDNDEDEDGDTDDEIAAESVDINTDIIYWDNTLDMAYSSWWNVLDPMAKIEHATDLHTIEVSMNLGESLYVELMDINIAATAGSCVLTGTPVD